MVHYKCGGNLTWEEQPRTLRLQSSLGTIYWLDEPESMTRCDECGLVGIPVEPVTLSVNGQTAIR